MESIPEIRHGKTGESAKKSHENDSGLQGLELWGQVEMVWTNNTGEMEEQRRLNRSLLDYYWKGINIVGEVLWISTKHSGAVTNYLRKGKEH